MFCNINIKKLRDSAVLPSYATDQALGADLYACTDQTVSIRPGETVMIPLGVAIEPTEHVGVFIFPRSGLAAKHGISLINSVGVIDPDYRGELSVPLYNHSEVTYTVNPGDRVAQLVVMPVYTARFIETNALGDTVRGSGGFGSTGLGGQT